ncbi:MAG: serine/threonine-protein kinase [Planctomycetaceae bacterium]
MDAIHEVDVLCDEFESEWKQGRTPQIVEFLHRTDSSLVESLLAELVKLDLYYRELNGETPSLADYETQFPDYKEVLRSLEAQIPTYIVQPRRLGTFLLKRHVGRGGFGDVWDAFDTKLQRRVALKTPRDREVDPAHLRLFLREARAVAQIEHPHVVRVYEQGEVNGRAYIAAEFVDGPTLARWVKWHDVDAAEAARICRDIALGLVAAHAAGVVHRDLKPGNVLMAAGDVPKIVDFGLAKRLDGTTTIGQPGTILGTFAYMSPEQARGNQYVDGRSDVYSLGAILYELLTHRTVFKGTAQELLDQIYHREPAAPRTLNQTIPQDLETICLKAISKLPADRYQTAQQLVDDLNRFLNGEPVLARRVGLVERSWRWIRTHKAWSALVGTVGVAALALAGIGWQRFEEYRAARQVVTLKTEPPGAKVVFVPLDPRTGEPVPEKKVKAGKSPVRQRLLPGDYLVVTYVDDEFFHEVYRHVPDKGAMNSLKYHQRHRNWEVLGGDVIELPSVTLHVQPFVAANMVKPFAGAEYVIAETEFTLVDYHKTLNTDQQPKGNGCIVIPSDDWALRCTAFDDAMGIAERAGGRLPTLFELQACLGRTQIAHESSIDPNHPVGEGDARRTSDGIIIYGLTSNVAEWTISFSPNLPEVIELEVDPPFEIVGAPPFQFAGPEAGSSRIVFGPLSDDEMNSPTDANHNRMFFRNTWRNDLGLRLARSIAPRFTD